MKKLLLCVLALGCAAVLMACEWSAVPLPLEGDEPQVSPAPDPSEITGQLAEYTRDHVDMALTIPDGWAFETLEEDGQEMCIRDRASTAAPSKTATASGSSPWRSCFCNTRERGWPSGRREAGG